jgi:hypothetical protein
MLVRNPATLGERSATRKLRWPAIQRALSQRTLEGVLAGAQCAFVRGTNRIENDLQSRTIESDRAGWDGIGAVIRRNLRSRPTGADAFRNGDDHSLFALPVFENALPVTGNVLGLSKPLARLPIQQCFSRAITSWEWLAIAMYPSAWPS